jgi:hypothetical protein
MLQLRNSLVFPILGGSLFSFLGFSEFVYESVSP